MKSLVKVLSPIRAALPGASVLANALLVAACGGGGGAATTSGPSVSSVTATGVSGRPVMYGQSLLITVSGSSLDSGLAVTSAGCKASPVLSTAAPYVSTAATAYYLCTASALGANQVSVTQTSGGAALATAAYTVPAPQVTLTVKNTLAVSGAIVFTLAPDKAPLTVDNFLAYVNAGFYDGLVFHRVVPSFMIQGGGYLPITPGVTPVAKATNAPIALEVNRGLSNTQWTVAMARTPVANSATSQFFINVVNNSAALDPSATSAGYAVFGTVSTGTAVVSSIVAAPCAPFAGFSECVPNPNVVIVSAVQTQ